MDVRVGLWRRLSTEELMLLNCGVGEDSWESLGLHGNPTGPFWRRSALRFLWREWCWSWNSSTSATSCEELTHGKDSDAGRDWGQEEKGMTEDEMVGWHHWLNARESEWTLGVGVGQGGLVCCNSWGRKVSDTTERLKWTEMILNTRLVLRGLYTLGKTKCRGKILYNLILTPYLYYHGDAWKQWVICMKQSASQGFCNSAIILWSIILF